MEKTHQLPIGVMIKERRLRSGLGLSRCLGPGEFLLLLLLLNVLLLLFMELLLFSHAFGLTLVLG